ncbi:MAG: hypothetical protein H0U59_09570 [Gemmatimonadaceae bacterium]|nr:hypothetical protein [Gemmatimonadaceae bacterium]
MRRLRCIRCTNQVTVHEAPVEHIDPARFVCGQCYSPVEAPQLQLHERVEHRAYDPAIAEIPF